MNDSELLAKRGFVGSHLVERLRADGIEPFVARRRDYDLTREAEYHIAERNVARVSSTGFIRATADGGTEIEVTARGQAKRVQLTVAESARPRAFSCSRGRRASAASRA